MNRNCCKRRCVESCRRESGRLSAVSKRQIQELLTLSDRGWRVRTNQRPAGTGKFTAACQSERSRAPACTVACWVLVERSATSVTSEKNKANAASRHLYRSCLSPSWLRSLAAPGFTGWETESPGDARQVPARSLSLTRILKAQLAAMAFQYKILHLDFNIFAETPDPVQRGGDWAGPQSAQDPPRYTKFNNPPINSRVYFNLTRTLKAQLGLSIQKFTSRL